MPPAAAMPIAAFAPDYRFSHADYFFAALHAAIFLRLSCHVASHYADYQPYATLLSMPYATLICRFEVADIDTCRRHAIFHADIRFSRAMPYFALR